MPTETSSSTAALTLLSEEEIMFRDAVAAFAEEEVRPRVAEMEKAGRIDPALLPKYFELGLMGIEVPEEYGGAGGSLFMVTLAVEELVSVGMDADARSLEHDLGQLLVQPERRCDAEGHLRK